MRKHGAGVLIETAVRKEVDRRWAMTPGGTGFPTSSGPTTLVEERKPVSSQNKWDRVPYFGRAESDFERRRASSGAEGAPGGERRRRTALIPRHSGERLADERKRRGHHPGTARRGHGRDGGARVADRAWRGRHDQAVARYVQVLGRLLDLVASFGDYSSPSRPSKGRDLRPGTPTPHPRTAPMPTAGSSRSRTAPHGGIASSPLSGST